MTETFLDMAIRHRDQDLLVAGAYGSPEGGKACSVGCFNREYGNRPSDISALAVSTSYPEWAHVLQEYFFENLPQESRADFHVDFARMCENVKCWESKYHETMVLILNLALPLQSPGDITIQNVINAHRRGVDVPGYEWNEEIERKDVVFRTFRRVIFYTAVCPQDVAFRYELENSLIYIAKEFTK